MFSFNQNKILGKGAFGVVYQAVWNGQPVAVKRVFENFEKWEGESDGERQFQLLARLSHPNVIKLLHVSRDEDFR